jgi:hypothetical protein
MRAPRRADRGPPQGSTPAICGPRLAGRPYAGAAAPSSCSLNSFALITFENIG